MCSSEVATKRFHLSAWQLLRNFLLFFKIYYKYFLLSAMTMFLSLKNTSEGRYVGILRMKTPALTGLKIWN